MARMNITNNDNRTVFPSYIEVTEKRAPTDESVKLLNEMQDKVISNIICRVSNTKNNVFEWEGYFMNIVNTTDFQSDGLLYLKLSVNGVKYEKKVKVKCDLMSRLVRGDFQYRDIDGEVQNFIFVQISILIGSILLDDREKFEKLVGEMVSYGAHRFDYKTLTDI